MAEYSNPRPTNPVGSTELDVAKDNLITHDLMINSPDPTITTRLGKTWQTLVGISQSVSDAIRAAGGQPLNSGVWAAGQTFEAYNQFMIFNGIAYKPLDTTPLPYGPTGAAPDGAFVGPFSEYTDDKAAQGETQHINESVFPKSFNQAAAVNDTCPAGTTALRDAVNNKIYLTSSTVSGTITALDFNAGTATVGGVGVTLVEHVNVNSSNITALTALVFDSLANMQSGTTIGGKSVSYALNQLLCISGTDSRGKPDTVQYFITASSGEIDLGGGIFANPLNFQTERVRVGNTTAASGLFEKDAVLVSRDLTGVTGTHGFTDYTTIKDVTDNGTYGVYDVRVTVEGTHTQDHLYCFQDRPISTVDNLGFVTGLYSRPELDSGNVGIRKAVDVYDPSGSAVISQNYGLFVRELTRATTNQAVRTEGNTPSSFGGYVAMGLGSTTNIGPDPTIQLKLGGENLDGANTLGCFANHTLTPTNNGTYYGFQCTPVVANGNTLASFSSFRATDAQLSGTGTVNEVYGMIINPMTTGVNRNYGILSLVSDGTGRKNIAVGGTAPNSYAGNSYFGGPTTVVPTAKVHCGAGGTAAGTAPLKLTSGSLLTTVENGAFEYDGTNLYFTLGGVRRLVNLT